MAAPIKETTSVTVERVVDEGRERLYQAFTSRDEVNNWFCNNSFVQGREGGLYLFIWNTEKYSATGLYKEVVENEKIVLTWRSTWEGNESEYPELLTVTFDEVGAGTKVTFFHEGMPDEGKEAYEWQWNKRLDDLKLYVETGAQPNIVNRIIIGIFPTGIPQERMDELGLKAGEGTMVGSLVPGYGAEKAGLQTGDIITHFKGEKITPDNPMNVIIKDNKPGDKIEVTAVRGDETLTLTMPLSPYPVPDIPESYKALADSVAPQYDKIIADLEAMFEGISEAQANQAPSESEWSANMVLAHLVYSEDNVQDSIGAHFANGSPQHWSGNDSTRLGAIVAVNPGVKGMIQALGREFDETLALWRNFPDDTASSNKGFLWNDAFAIAGWIQHTHNHMQQIKEAIEAAKN